MICVLTAFLITDKVKKLFEDPKYDRLSSDFGMEQFDTLRY